MNRTSFKGRILKTTMKNKLEHLTNYSLLFIAFFCSSVLTAQLTTTTIDANTAVNGVLLGNGVNSIGMPTFSGDPLQLASFDGSASSIDMPTGIVLCTANATELDPNVTGAFITNAFEDDDLLDIANSVPPLIGESFVVSRTRDVATLEFDFIPISDTMTFDFIFASSEYNAFENTRYNDVFAFLISGPGITGPYNSPAGFPGGAQNIAIVPGSTPPLPITISSVNENLNSSLFINSPADPTLGLSLDGFTIPLTALAEVQCGETYHIKIAIADGSDASFASAIFLEEGSFSAKGSTFSSNINTNSSHPSLSVNEVYEGCGGIQIEVEREETNIQDTLRFTKSGSAIPGVDYNNFPDSVIFPIGEDRVSITIEAFKDNISETPETIDLVLETQFTNCGTPLSDTISLTIVDPPEVVATIPDIDIQCSTEPQNLRTFITSGIGPFSYTWSTGDEGIDQDSLLELTVPAYDTTYIVTITDGCNHKTTEVMGNVNFPATNLQLSVNDTLTCANSNTSMNMLATDGVEPYNYWWTSPSSDVNVPGTVVQSGNGGVFTAFATDFCGIDTVSTTFSINTYNPININPLNDVYVNCPNEEVTSSFTANGGTGNYIYTWNNWINTDRELSEFPENSTSYTLQVTDDCNADTATAILTTIVASYIPLVVVNDKEAVGCKGDQKELGVSAFGGRGNYNYIWNSTAENSDTVNYTLREDGFEEVKIYDECNLFTTAEFEVDVKNPTAFFNVSYFDVDNVYFDNLSEHEDRLVYSWDFGDRNTSSVFEPEHQYMTQGIYTPSLTVTDAIGCTDSYSVEIKSPGIVWLANSFSPNGDGINDEWQPIHNGIDNYDLRIINRWGDTVFQASESETDKKWTGNENPQGLYQYKLTGKNKYTLEDIDLRGTIYLIR